MRPGCAADHSLPSSAAVMEESSYTSTHPLGHTGPVTGSLYFTISGCLYSCLTYTKRMRRVILSSMVCPALQYFSTLSHKPHGFRAGEGGEFIEHKMCALILSTKSSETFLIVRRIKRDIVINVRTSACEVPVLHKLF